MLKRISRILKKKIQFGGIYMRKKFLVMSAAVATLSLASAFSAFAGSWQTDTWGTFYQNDDGSRPVYAGWFTDPADGAMYYMDPDGYMMSNTTVEGFRLGDDGRRIEKTEEDIAKENERKALLASRPSPAKAHAAASVAVTAVQDATAATGTIRTTYMAEMDVLSERILGVARDTRTDAANRPMMTDNNTQLTFGFTNADGYPFISATTWKIMRTTGVDYHENAIELVYHYDAVGAPDDVIFEEAFRQLLVAGLGNTEGQNAYNTINTERAAGTTTFDRSGSTDTGNSYTLTYRNNLVTVKVVCSEIAPATDVAAEETADAAEETAEEAVVTPTTSVIVAGQGQAAEAETETDTEADAEETETAEETADAAEETEAADAQ